MASPASHPRRRPQTQDHPPFLSPSCPRPIRKVDTFHASTNSLSDMIDPVTDATYIPRRSHTSSRTLKSLIRPRCDIADLLERFDKTLSGLTHASSLIQEDACPVPTVLLAHAVTTDDDNEDCMLFDVKPTVVEHHHHSDSGLGDSIATSASFIHSAGAAINHSFSAFADASADNGRALSDFAAKEIKLRILDRLARDESLEAFHQIVADVPRRIGTKEIRNLRDLEKNLLLLAFDAAPSPKSYIRFCEQTVTCILATVGHIEADDRQTPADRPFTNSYALDLIDQIRRYAQIMAETRAREAEGKPGEEEDYSPNEELIIQGGLSHDGTPAQLVRKKANGDILPLATDRELEAVKQSSPMKRFLDNESALESGDDGVRRSMARRRKSDRPGDVEHKCRDCDKKFRRPCDLTKHEKTHSRPWKCPDTKCRYHVDGWPTEKEMERHFNDRHFSAPKMFSCHYDDCPYTSKRESNCKQHMEKCHGFVYVRSRAVDRDRKEGLLGGPARKSVSGGPGSSRTSSAPLTPFTNTPGSFPTATSSPIMQVYDLNFTGQPTPLMAPYDYPPVTDDRRLSDATIGSSALTYSTNHSPYDDALDNVVKPEEPMFEHINTMVTPVEPMFEPMFEPAAKIVTPVEPLFEHIMTNMSMTSGNLGTMFQHQPLPTPALSDLRQPFDLNTPVSHINTYFGNGNGGSGSLHLSPTGHADMTLLSQPQLQVDEGFGEDTMFLPSGDFTLFDDPIGGYDAVSGADMFSGFDLFDTNGGQFGPDL